MDWRSHWRRHWRIDASIDARIDAALTHLNRIDAALTQHWRSIDARLLTLYHVVHLLSYHLGGSNGGFSCKIYHLFAFPYSGMAFAHVSAVPVRTWLDAAGLVPDIPMESFVVETRRYFFKLGVILTPGRKFFRTFYVYWTLSLKKHSILCHFFFFLSCASRHFKHIHI
jgi:hypothetical protein